MSYPMHRVRPGLYERVPGPPYDAQKAFVRQWREKHRYDLYGAPWICPLCGYAVQDNPLVKGRDVLARLHQDGHGPDWDAYESAGQSAQAGAAARGGE